MANREDLVEWLEAALRQLGGAAKIAEVSREIWRAHEADLRESGDLFFTWQYDVRWAAHRLRKAGRLRPETLSPRGVWELKDVFPEALESA